MNRDIAKFLRRYIRIFIIEIKAIDFGGGPVTFKYNWPSRPVEKLVLALPLYTKDSAQGRARQAGISSQYDEMSLLAEQAGGRGGGVQAMFRRSWAWPDLAHLVTSVLTVRPLV